MFNRLTISRRIVLGFGSVLLVLAILAIWTLLGINTIVGNADEVITGNALKGEMSQREVDHLNWAASLSRTLNDSEVTEVTVEMNPKKCAFGSWYYGDGRRTAEAWVPELAPLFADIEEHHTALHESAMDIKEVFSSADTELTSFLQEMKTAHLAWAHRVKDVFVDTTLTDFENVELDHTRCTFGAWLHSDSLKEMMAEHEELVPIIEETDAVHEQLHGSAKVARGMLIQDDRAGAAAYYMNTTSRLAGEVLEGINKIIEWNNEHLAGYKQAIAIYENNTRPALQGVQEHLREVVATVNEHVMTDAQMLAAANGTQFSIVTFSLLAIAIGVASTIIIGRSIVNALNLVMCSLGNSSQELAGASEQVAQGSEQIAEGASQQASSLEEMTSSLEELSAMVKQTAGNARRANDLSQETRKAADEGSAAIHQMDDAIERIKNSSDETAKIVKTIDEIAFQTNLLALNAAVEAARAGEAGKGFAVVAEEVRNLAQRSAEAARTTSQLLEGAQEEAKNGVLVSRKVGEMLMGITHRVQEVSNLISEVSEASEQQAGGIEQLNNSATQMDALTQRNAASAEESSSASEELNAQAMELAEVVETLARLCGASVNSIAQLHAKTSTGLQADEQRRRLT